MATLGQIFAGARITAALLQAVAPVCAYKGSDQTIASSTTQTNDTALFIPVNGNGIYLWLMMLDYEGNTQGAGDIKISWAVPTSTTMRYHRLSLDQTGASTLGFLNTEANTPIMGTNGTGNTRAALMVGSMNVGAGGGTMQFKWAQNTSNATGTIVHAGSILAAWQVG